MSQLQTLDRGIQALTIVSEQDQGLTIAGLADRLGVHRAIAYRIVATLEAHALVSRGADGLLRLGSGVLALASRFEPQLRTVAQPLLRELARDTHATAFLSAAQGDDCVALLVAEPDAGLIRVGYRVGSRHPLSQGAAGIAILAGRPPSPDDSMAVRRAREQGYSLTKGQLQPGAVGVASPIRSDAADYEASVGVVALVDLDTKTAIASVRRCAQRIAELING